VCADISDLREMATNEDIAANFYKIGNAEDLAAQLIAILESPELQLRMAERNFAAGVQMTMASVVRNYLRWFELNQFKRELRNTRFFASRQRVWPYSLSPSPDEILPAWTFPLNSFPNEGDGLEADFGLESAGRDFQSAEFADALAWGGSDAPTNHLRGDEL